MALSANTVFEVRTTGSATNGGGFVTGATGTDWSQQDPVKYALTGVTSSGSGNTVLTASASADMVGNIAQCISGTNFRAGFYQIVSMVAGVSITFSTNAAGSSICTGVGASGVINIGGAVDALATLNSSVSPNNAIFVKAGTYPPAPIGGIIFTAGNGNNPIFIVGYDTTRVVGANTDTKPLFTSAVDNTSLLIFNGCDHLKMYNLRATSTASARGTGFLVTGTGGYFYWENCECDGTGNAWSCGISATRLTWVNCAAVNGTGDVMLCSAATTAQFMGCFIYNNAGVGILMSTTTPVAASVISILNCVVAKNTDGFSLAGTTVVPSTFIDGSVFSGNTGAGILLAATNAGNTNGTRIINTIMYANGTYGLNVTGNSGLFNPNSVLRNNAYGANGTNPTNGVTDSVQVVTLTANPFVDSAHGDYRLNSTANGGAALKGVAFPRYIGSNSVNTGPGSTDAGALQSASTALLPLGG